MNKQPCELWVGTRTRYFRLATFDSITECRQYIKSCGTWLSCYTEIKRIK